MGRAASLVVVGGPRLGTRTILCSEASLVNPGSYAFRAVTLKCRSWGCDLCYSDRKRQLVELALSGQATTFITLTSNPATGGTPDTRARHLARAWPVIVKRAKKKYGYKTIPYLCVFEATKRGEPHLHILCRVKWIDQAWLSNQMKDLISAPIVWVKEVKSQKHMASYIAKYIGKEPERFQGTKRYWRTQDWRIVPVEVEDESTIWSDRWYTIKNSLPGLKRVWERLGYDVVMEGRMLVAMAEPSPHDARRGEQRV